MERVCIISEERFPVESFCPERRAWARNEKGKSNRSISYGQMHIPLFRFSALPPPPCPKRADCNRRPEPEERENDERNVEPTFRSVKKHWCVCVLALSTCFTRKFSSPQGRENRPISFSIVHLKSSICAVKLNTNKTAEDGQSRGKGSSTGHLPAAWQRGKYPPQAIPCSQKFADQAPLVVVACHIVRGRPADTSCSDSLQTLHWPAGRLEATWTPALFEIGHGRDSPYALHLPGPARHLSRAQAPLATGRETRACVFIFPIDPPACVLFTHMIPLWRDMA